MNNNVDRIMKNRMIFLIALIRDFGQKVTINTKFINDFADFAFDNLMYNFDELSLITFIKIDENKLITMYEPENILYLYTMYLNEICNPLKLAETYNEVGFEDIEIITDLASQFIEYKEKANKKHKFKYYRR